MTTSDESAAKLETSLTPDLQRLPSIVRSSRTDAIYNCHSYPTKVPVEAIRPFIESFSNEGEAILDMFAGSGMTGLAAARVGRQAVLSDISVLGQHIAHGYLTRAAADEVKRKSQRIIADAQKSLGDLYRTRRIADGSSVDMVRSIWSFVYSCPNCKAPLVYFDHLDSAGRPPTSCPGCRGRFSRRSWPRLPDIPVRVVVRDVVGSQVSQPVQDIDTERIARASTDERLAKVPSASIAASREMFGRSGLGRTGNTETRHFFSARNALALLELWTLITRLSDSAIRQKLAFAFTACLTRASRRYQWGPKRPLNAQNQTYYIAPVYFEWNVFELFERKVQAALRSDAMLFEEPTLFNRSWADKVSYTIASADNLSHVPDSSVAYIFTDPPFGSNIFYSDMSLFHEAWLGRLTDDSSEAVLHTSGPKRVTAFARYESLLRGAFAEAWRVLQPGRFMSVVFGNSSGAVWHLVQRALRDAGFGSPIHVAILDKGQRSIKGLNSGKEGVVTVDLVLTLQKTTGEPPAAAAPLSEDSSLCDLASSALRRLAEVHRRNPSYLYAAVLMEAISRRRRLDDLHYGDLLVALRSAGFPVDPQTGLLQTPITANALR